ncbi:DDE-type integrase/transposase/recombinase [Patescibacteria group bacterium]|nr:DDE-type integrase/transposase/recombinase [Patescibacteria group bacterium]MBU1721184.1 DDE-type integrase/transposase/recombinase [Patescibacteria group bacterium]MBU1901108.1 DDE-type integrase/transposase/recombinase [Patescibacteria group bacterium]
MLHIDTVEIRLQGVKRYVLTAIDSFSRFGFAYAYKNHTSASAKDFLLKLHDFFGEHMSIIHTDNGTEFHKYFNKAVTQLNLTHYWSRVRKSTDNAKDERFNRTFRDECMAQGAFNKNLHIFNANILAWVIEYLTIRPHQSLNYLTPFEFISQTTKLSTNWSSSTALDKKRNDCYTSST